MAPQKWLVNIANTAAAVVMFYPVTVLFVTVFLHFAQRGLFSAIYRNARETRRSRAMLGVTHYTLRAIINVSLAFGLPAITGITPWSNPLVMFVPSNITIAPILSWYYRVQLGYMFFRITAYRITVSVMVFELLRTFHIMLLAILNPVWVHSGATVPGALLTLFFYFDLIDAAGSLKRSSMLDGGRSLMSWRVYGYLWLLFRILLVGYGTWQNGFGWFMTWVIMGLLLFVQFLLWLILPTDKSYKNFRPRLEEEVTDYSSDYSSSGEEEASDEELSEEQ